MKKLLYISSMVVGLSLLTLGTALAEPTHPNEVGLYTTADGFGPTGTFTVGVPVDVYLILTIPADVGETGDPFVSVFGFECNMNFSPIPDNDLVILDTVLRPGSLDIGRYKDINEGFLEFVVGTTLEDPIPVINETAELARFTFLNLGSGTTEVTLSPPGQPMFDGEMAFLGGFLPSWGTPYGRIMHPVSGSHEAPVFMFNGDAVPVESESFGSVKALYR